MSWPDEVRVAAMGRPHRNSWGHLMAFGALAAMSLLGFYLVECDTMEEALEAAKALPQGVAHMEVRAVNWTGGL
jgi:hypothetical protein